MIRDLSFRVNINNLEEEDATGLELNDIGCIKLRTQKSIMYDDYRKNHQTGSFILVDEATNATVAAGMFREPAQEEMEYMI